MSRKLDVQSLRDIDSITVHNSTSEWWNLQHLYKLATTKENFNFLKHNAELMLGETDPVSRCFVQNTRKTFHQIANIIDPVSKLHQTNIYWVCEMIPKLKLDCVRIFHFANALERKYSFHHRRTDFKSIAKSTQKLNHQQIAKFLTVAVNASRSAPWSSCARIYFNLLMGEHIEMFHNVINMMTCVQILNLLLAWRDASHLVKLLEYDHRKCSPHSPDLCVKIFGAILLLPEQHVVSFVESSRSTIPKLLAQFPKVLHDKGLFPFESEFDYLFALLNKFTKPEHLDSLFKKLEILKDGFSQDHFTIMVKQHCLSMSMLIPFIKHFSQGKNFIYSNLILQYDISTLEMS